MKGTLRYIFGIFFAMGLAMQLFSFYAFAQTPKTNDNIPLSPPVDIVFTAVNSPAIGQELILTLKVAPFEDMHVEIACLLPVGITVREDEGITVCPFRDSHRFSRQYEGKYYGTALLYVGPLAKGAAKEFIFRLNIPAKGKYELVSYVDALAKWGTKEESLTVDIK